MNSFFLLGEEGGWHRLDGLESSWHSLDGLEVGWHRLESLHGLEGGLGCNGGSFGGNGEWCMFDGGRLVAQSDVVSVETLSVPLGNIFHKGIPFTEQSAHNNLFLHWDDVLHVGVGNLGVDLAVPLLPWHGNEVGLLQTESLLLMDNWLVPVRLLDRWSDGLHCVTDGLHWHNSSYGDRGRERSPLHCWWVGIQDCCCLFNMFADSFQFSSDLGVHFLPLISDSEFCHESVQITDIGIVENVVSQHGVDLGVQYLPSRTELERSEVDGGNVGVIYEFHLEFLWTNVTDLQISCLIL
jgi:hypothetical protein